jgi:hypothetical protein
MLKEPVLIILRLDLLFKVKIDALDYALSSVLGQRKDKMLYSIAFYSKKLHGLELNYLIYHKELIAIIEVFKK